MWDWDEVTMFAVFLIFITVELMILISLIQEVRGNTTARINYANVHFLQTLYFLHVAIWSG